MQQFAYQELFLGTGWPFGTRFRKSPWLQLDFRPLAKQQSQWISNYTSYVDSQLDGAIS